jgi:hypothetical protein
MATVRFTSSDGTAIIPESTLFSETGSFVAVLKASGNQTITVTDIANPSITGTSNPILVVANPSTNLARGKIATQSSSLPGYAGAGAASAVDGSTDGNFFNGSVTVTNLETNPWWQVDLGASSTVTSIVIWNRTDCCGSRLNDYWVFVSDTPFGATDTPSALQNRAGTWSSHQTTAPNPSTIIAAGNTHGRYVRVQLTNPNYLSLAEVQVLSSPVPDWNLAAGRTATQSSTLPGYPTAGASSAVDGNADGNFFDGSVTATNLDTEPWWQVDLGVSTIIDFIVIYNRTDCCGERLGDYYVFVSDAPFLPNDTISAMQNRPGVFGIHKTGSSLAAALLDGAQGRYVRIQVPGQNYLSLAEVQVAGTPNLAQGKAASQSSTLSGYPAAGAAAAVDGNTDGNFFDGSVTATNADLNAWWQVDLGASAMIRAIELWNRADCCSSRLNNFWIYVSDTPFAPTDTPDTLRNRAATWSLNLAEFGSRPNSGFGSGYGNGRYVRIQLGGTGYLSLAEVQVFGTFVANP